MIGLLLFWTLSPVRWLVCDPALGLGSVALSGEERVGHWTISQVGWAALPKTSSQQLVLSLALVTLHASLLPRLPGKLARLGRWVWLVCAVCLRQQDDTAVAGTEMCIGGV